MREREGGRERAVERERRERERERGGGVEEIYPHEYIERHKEI